MSSSKYKLKNCNNSPFRMKIIINMSSPVLLILSSLILLCSSQCISFSNKLTKESMLLAGSLGTVNTRCK